MSGDESTVFDGRTCQLGEGPLWHPLREQLFWFDILGQRLLSRDATGPMEWQFDEHVSAAGWVDRDRLLIASASRLFTFDLASGEQNRLVDLERDRPETRSNDGRADPWGGFWIGTMGLNAEDGAGSIYRYFEGSLERLYADITITNAICFSPDRSFAYYSDTVTHLIMRQPLDDRGWPKGTSEVFADLTADRLNPDGAVVDREGYLWNAQWGASRVARYAPDGSLDRIFPVPALQPSCPAFGGQNLDTLFVTTAVQGQTNPGASEGLVYELPAGIRGQAEHRVLLGDA